MKPPLPLLPGLLADDWPWSYQARPLECTPKMRHGNKGHFS
jgi:hypothetical protein